MIKYFNRCSSTTKPHTGHAQLVQQGAADPRCAHGGSLLSPRCCCCSQSDPDIRSLSPGADVELQPRPSRTMAQVKQEQTPWEDRTDKTRKRKLRRDTMGERECGGARVCAITSIQPENTHHASDMREHHFSPEREEFDEKASESGVAC
uniref:Uncharacterized protein n=1 Tax=Knipowitschia caucasica TaxID=637954 RepID=A0AAV2MFV0_KNICA